jgi:predicted dehydrogenase
VVIRAGIIGMSEGNGHPFSFSAIVNGYDREAFARAGWPAILDYLGAQPPEAFGFPNVRVTHAWTQDRAITEKLRAACRIEHTASTPEAMLGKVDALIVARDDWTSHAPLALPFLERGVPVFVDKPLALDEATLSAFRPHLEAGRLMSTSGLRYARELDGMRERIAAIGPVRLVSGTVLNGLEKYGVHLLDAAAGLGLPPAVAVLRLPARHESFALTLADGALFLLNCLGEVERTFHLSVFGEKGHAHADLHDNFTAFRRTLSAFFTMVENRAPPVPPAHVVNTMRLVAAARALKPGQRWEAGHG